MEYIPAKTIVTRNKTRNSKWFGYDYMMNIYRGCSHGCIYCDSRCSCYRNDRFDEVRAKADALRIIRDDLRRKVHTGVICTGAMSDPYNPYEKELLLTRHALELIDAFEFGVGVITKSNLVARDIDILQDIQVHSPVLVKLSVTAADDKLCARLEPHAPPSSARFAALKDLTDAGVFAGILLMPVLPFIEDNEENISRIIERAIESGARFIYPRIGVTLRGNQKEWYYEKAEELYPGIRETYIETYGDKIYCNSPQTRKLMKIIRNKCDKYGVLYRMDDIIRASRIHTV